MGKILNKLRFLFFLVRVFASGEYRKAKVYARYYGVKMGKNVRITGALHFPTESFLIEIGDNVTLTHNITFHTHDGGVGVLRNELKGINIFGRIKIGNNVFIGSNSTLLPGVVIGNNVVIGSDSVVTKSIPDNVVCAGNPAKVLRTLEEYRQKALQHGIYIHDKDPSKRKSLILEAMAGKEKSNP